MKILELIPQTPTIGVSNPVAGTTPGQATIGVDPQAAAKAQAMAVKQIQDQKKQIQDQIKAKEQELLDLRKKLSELG